jgi:dihydroorotase
MPNLKPPVTTVAQAAAYRERILAALPPGLAFEPLMTLYLTDNTPAGEIDRAPASGFVHAVKLYPAGATTNSDAGVTDHRQMRAALARMEEARPAAAGARRGHRSGRRRLRPRAVFIERVLAPLLRASRACAWCSSTSRPARAAQFVEAGRRVAGTITAHHLLLNRNAIFAGGMRPHHYCLPVLKRETHREALVAAATRAARSSSSAPIRRRTRAAPRRRPAAAPAATRRTPRSSSTPRFSRRPGALDRLEAFASFHGARLLRPAAQRPDLWQGLCVHRWREVFVERRAELLRSTRFIVFGHASHDALGAPFVGLCGKALFIEVDAAWLALPPTDSIDQLDARLAKVFGTARFAPRDWQPLPLLGIPGATAENEDVAYYDDERQFRPPRRMRAGSSPGNR